LLQTFLGKVKHGHCDSADQAKQTEVHITNRTERAKIAQETLDIFQRGYYLCDGKQVDCQSRFSAEFLTEKRLEEVSPASGSFAPKYTIVNESVVDTVAKFGG